MELTCLLASAVISHSMSRCLIEPRSVVFRVFTWYLCYIRYTFREQTYGGRATGSLLSYSFVRRMDLVQNHFFLRYRCNTTNLEQWNRIELAHLPATYLGQAGLSYLWLPIVPLFPNLSHMRTVPFRLELQSPQAYLLLPARRKVKRMMLCPWPDALQIRRRAAARSM
jgi:hypothetical protein